MTNPDRTHALYSASSSSRWLKCHGSIQRSAGMPAGIASGYALDGTEAHELVEYALVNQFTSAYEAKIMGDFSHWVYRHDTEQERVESAQYMLDEIYNIMAAYAAPDTVVYLETQFVFPTYHNDDCGGTSDVTIFVPQLDIMVVIDFKHGAGVAVEVEENTQALTYAVGSRQELRRSGLCNSGKTLYRLLIVQPRAFHKAGATREWTCDDQRLDQHIIDVNWAIEQSKKQNPTIAPGRYCRWCPALSACPEAEKAKMQAIIPTYVDPNTLKHTGLPVVTELSVERIADILSMADMVTEWLKAVKSQAVALAREGVAIPGKKLVFAQAKSKWHTFNENDERTIAGHLAAISELPANAFYRPKLVTITEAKAKVKQAIYERVGKTKAKPYVEAANKAMAPLMTKDTSGNVTLVDRDDRRPEINIAQLVTFNPVMTGDDND